MINLSQILQFPKKSQILLVKTFLLWVQFPFLGCLDLDESGSWPPSENFLRDEFEEFPLAMLPPRRLDA